MALRRIAIFAVGLALASAARADPLDDAALDDQPQYYLMALPPAPVGEIAEAVLGEALGLPYKVDPDVDAEMALRLDGAYAPKALAQEFGHRLWNVDVALVEKPSDGLWLIPKDELAAAQAQGATLVAPIASTPARASASRPVAPTPAPGPQGRADRDAGWSWLAWLALGWVGGAASVWAGLKLRAAKRPARRPPAPSLALPEPERADADDLIIPVFSEAGEPTRRD